MLIDEATKDHKLNIWSAVTNPGLARKVLGFAMFGDPRQLSPINMTTPKYNEHSSRGNTPFQTRLMEENFPYTMIVQQNRAAIALMDFPNKRLYDGKLRTSERMTKITLDEQAKGLKAALITILKQEDGVDEAVLRTSWIELPGTRLTNQFNQSKVVLEHGK